MNRVFNVGLGSLFLTIWAIFMMFFAVAVVFAILSYVLYSIGLSRIAQRRQHPNPWMAWIPFASIYLYAILIDRDLVVGKKKIQNFPVWYLVTPFIIAFAAIVFQMISMIPLLGILIGFAGSLACSAAIITMQVYVKYRFYKKYRYDKAVMYSVLSSLVPLAEPIIMLIISKNEFNGEGADVPDPSIY